MAHSPAQVATATQEFPLTSSMRQTIAAQTRQLRRLEWLLATVAFVGLTAVGIWAASTSPDVAGGLVAAFAGTGLVLALIFVAVFEWVIRRGTNRDLATGTYCQTTGPMQVRRETRTDSDDQTRTVHVLVLADRQFEVSGKDLLAALAPVDWGVVTYSPYGHVVFTVTDRSGEQVYTRPGYSTGS